MTYPPDQALKRQLTLDFLCVVKMIVSQKGQPGHTFWDGGSRPLPLWYMMSMVTVIKVYFHVNPVVSHTFFSTGVF